MEDFFRYTAYFTLILTFILLLFMGRLFYKSQIYIMKRSYIVNTYKDLLKIDEKFEIKDFELLD